MRQYCILAGNDSDYHRKMKLQARSLVMALALVAPLGAQSPAWRGTWSATGLGRTLTGSWTATRGEDSNTVLGSWTLLDPTGKALASGSWSARKSEKLWKGAWQTRDARGQTLSGSWTAQAPNPAPSGLTGLLESALSQVANGTWQRGGRKGAWAIRAYPPDRPPEG